MAPLLVNGLTQVAPGMHRAATLKACGYRLEPHLIPIGETGEMGAFRSYKARHNRPFGAGPPHCVLRPVLAALGLHSGSHMNKKVSAAIFLASSALVSYVVLVGSSPLPNRVIDRDSSGIVSFGEAIDAHDIGRREGAGGPDCVEYFWYKDGLLAYEKCGSAD